MHILLLTIGLLVMHICTILLYIFVYIIKANNYIYCYLSTTSMTRRIPPLLSNHIWAEKTILCFLWYLKTRVDANQHAPPWQAYSATPTPGLLPRLRKQLTSNQCWLIVSLTSAMLAQHKPFRICWGAEDRSGNYKHWCPPPPSPRL